MSLLKKRNGDVEPYTSIPNRLIRSKHLDVYDKLVFCCIASCVPSFPSYEAIMEWTGASRERVWKSLKRLEEVGAIERFKKGRSIHYVTHWANSSPGELVGGESVRFANSTSSPGELEPVRLANSKKNKEKEQIKRALGDENSPETKPRRLTVSELMALAKDWTSL